MRRRAAQPQMWAFLKQLWASVAILIGFPLAGQSTPVFHDQSDIGRELKVPVHQWSDAAAEPKGIIVAVQGLTLYGRTYDSLARHLVDRGYTVYAPDLRGFGDWRSRAAEFGGDSGVHFTQSKEDLTNVLAALRRRYRGMPIYCLGESLGANYALWEASTDPQLLDGVIVAGTCYKLSLHPTPRWLVGILSGLVHPKHPLNLAPYMRPILSNDRTITEACLSDPEMCTALSATDLIKSSITRKHTMELIANIPESLPILLIAGAKDKIQKTKTIPQMVKQIGSKKVTVVVLEHKGHLLFEHQQLDPEVAQTIDDWLDRNANDTNSGLRTSQALP